MVCTSHKPTRGGYFLISRNGIPNQYVHVLVCEKRYGPMNGLYATHSCDNRACINPDHIRPGTHQSNMQEAFERKRFRCGPKPWVQGENQHLSKLTESQVLEILSRPDSSRSLAKEFGVSQPAIQAIKLRRTWTHLTPVILHKNPTTTKLTPEQVVEIYNREGSFRQIGIEFGITHNQVSSIKKKKSWKNILR